MALLVKLPKIQGSKLFSREIIVTKGAQSWQVNAIPATRAQRWQVDAIPAGKALGESPVSLGGTLPTRDMPLLPMESLSLYLPIHLI